MHTNFESRIEQKMELSKDSVWVLPDKKPFDYSDGSERYLWRVFSRAKDLSSNSYELERWIKDWPSEYHLSRKRSQLLRGFDFDRSKKVLEVGCGCGAITRFLGEAFDDVISIEGSMARARAARLRTRDMDNVTILCAPFQEIRFKERFDIIFCIGVFEYSGGFVDSPDPYDTVLGYFREMLNPDGHLVLAIENQFGLKYFSSSKEDHTNVMFDGIEGYPRHGKRFRTFGYDELRTYMNKYFRHIDFYFPYPDYKIPSCVLSEEFLGKVRAGELVANYHFRDHLVHGKPLFDERLACLQLDRNNQLPFFSNSFLVVAGDRGDSIRPQALGILYSKNRQEGFQTITRFIEHEDGTIWSHKAVSAKAKDISPMLKLQPSTCEWQPGLSLQTLITRRAQEKNVTIDELFAPCKAWARKLESFSVTEDDRTTIDGRYMDCIWKNCYLRNDDCTFIDQEWEWYRKISMNVVIIRAIYCFLNDVSYMPNLHPVLRKKNMKSSIRRIAASMGVQLVDRDFREFVDLESRSYAIISKVSPFPVRAIIDLRLLNRSIPAFCLKIMAGARKMKDWLSMVRRYARKFLLPAGSD